MSLGPFLIKLGRDAKLYGTAESRKITLLNIPNVLKSRKIRFIETRRYEKKMTFKKPLTRPVIRNRLHKFENFMHSLLCFFSVIARVINESSPAV